jgi:hypothetical protein
MQTQTLEPNRDYQVVSTVSSIQKILRTLVIFACLATLGLLAGSCGKQAGADAVQSDANGYICLKCGAKYYTTPTVFIGPKCPKCQEDSLMPAMGYYCEKDKHLTIRAQRGDNRPIVCEVCQTTLVDAMRAPRESELKTWGAVKAP